MRWWRVFPKLMEVDIGGGSDTQAEWTQEDQGRRPSVVG